MKKFNIKFVLFTLLIILGLSAVSFSVYNTAFADHCSEDPSDESCHMCVNGASYPLCDCAYDGLEEVGGFCVSPCGSGQNRNESGECVSYCDDFNACNPGAYEACEYESCQTCPEGQDGTYPECGICEEPTAGTYPDCVCANGASNPPMCNDYCYDDTAINYGEALPCEYEENNYCCADSTAKNFDPQCPDDTATPPKIEDNSGQCQYCTKGDPAFECEAYYCDASEFPDATNGQSLGDCDAANPDKTCVSYKTECTWPQIYYCPDIITPADNGETQADCDASIPIEYPPCMPDDTFCVYPEEYYCGDDRALNYDEGGLDCQANYPNADCIESQNVCTYAYCTVGFTLDVECPSGYNFSTPEGEYYWYSYQYSPTPPTPHNEVCTGLTVDEIDYLKNYFEQIYCGEGQSVACEGGFCGQIDWCPVEGVQTDPTECVDVCPDDEGIQTSESQCTLCPDGVCDVDASCGILNGSSVESENNIVGIDACSSGTLGSITYNNGAFTWGCDGVANGADAICSAGIDCGSDRYYCDFNDQCLPSSATCNPPNDCVNSNLCVTKGSVSLNSSLDVTPTIINKGDSCTIDIGNGPNGEFGVFESFKNNTHCILSNQDAVISVFDPLYAGNTNPDLGPVVPTTFTESNIQKDTIYTLRCYDGNEPASESGYEKSVGACRLNLKSIEVN